MSAKGFRRCCDTPNQQSAPHLFGCTHHVASPVRVEVTQADRDAAAELHLVVSGNRSPFDYRCADTIRIGNSDHWPIVQAFAIHRHAPTTMLREARWREIESAPKDGTHFLAFWATVNSFENCFGVVTWKTYDGTTGWFENDNPVGDFTHWMSLPSPPQRGE